MRKIIIPITLIILFLTGCKGPNQKIYENELKVYLNNSADPQNLSEIPEKLIPLLNENTYTDEKDLKGKTELMYKTSVLLSAVLKQLNHEKNSLTLFMNAYLLSYESDKDKALKDLRGLLPKSADLTKYEELHIPVYTVKTSENKDEISQTVTLSNDHSDLILQAVCGDIYYKMKKKDNLSKINLISFTVFHDSKKIATASWNREDDQITVKRLK